VERVLPRMAGVMGMAGELRSLIRNLRRFVLVNVVIYDDLCWCVMNRSELVLVVETNLWWWMCYESNWSCACEFAKNLAEFVIKLDELVMNLMSFYAWWSWARGAWQELGQGGLLFNPLVQVRSPRTKGEPFVSHH
jgi:hypothetical protein